MRLLAALISLFLTAPLLAHEGHAIASQTHDMEHTLYTLAAVALLALVWGLVNWLRNKQ